MVFFLFFPENRLWYFTLIVSFEENLHEMSNPIFGGGKEEKYLKMSSAEIFTQGAQY